MLTSRMIWQNFLHLLRNYPLRTKRNRCERRRGKNTPLPVLLEELEDRTLLSAGALDTSFGDGGKVLTNFTTPGSDDNGQDVVAYQSDGKSILVGSSSGDMVVTRYNTDGSLDTSFGSNGSVRIDFGGTADVGYGVAVDSQNRVLVGGVSYQGGTGYDFAVARLTTGGALDTTFDSDGKKTIDFGGTFDVGLGVAVDSQDRVLVGGYSYQLGGTGYDFAVARLTAAGALDTGFDSDGKKTIDLGGTNDFGQGVAVDSQDRVLVGGYSYQGGTGYDFAVARLTAAGALDTGFDSDGKKTIDLGGTNDFGQGVAVDSQDRVLVGGYSYQGGTGYDFAVARLTAAGSLDTSFDGDGKKIIDFDGPNDVGQGVAVDSQDRVLVGGYSFQGAGGVNFAVARLTANGALDTTLDSDGKQTIDFGGTIDYGRGVVVDSQDRVLVGGVSYRGGTGADFAVARLTSAGALDTGFDSDGKVTTDIGYPGDDLGQDVIAYQSDGKSIVVGSSNGDMIVTRYNTDGSLDTSFGTSGSVRIDFAGTNDVGVGVAVDSQDRVLVGGASYQPGKAGNVFAVACLTAAGALDTTFDSDGKQTIDFGGTNDVGLGVAVDSQDRVLVGGYSYYSYQGGTGYDFAVARLTAAGSLDTAFDSDGKKIIDFGGTDDVGLGVAVDSQDRVLLGGYSYQSFNSGSFTGADFAVARVTAAGALDTTFNSSGKQTIDFGGTSDYGRGVAVDSQDRVLVGGFSYQNSQQRKFHRNRFCRGPADCLWSAGHNLRQRCQANHRLRCHR